MLPKEVKEAIDSSSSSVSIPEFAPNKTQEAVDASKFKVRYAKIDFDDFASVAELESIETRAIRDDGIYVLSRKDFVFQDRIFMLVSYMEKTN